ncbi:MAG: DUF86 domain-containing protein [Phycisphaeraceae bacterium]|nr:MAG: DUF86 domain-containing protein [Phycisphaeraceae bacterium]
MLDHAVEAVEMIKGRSQSDLDSDRQLNLSLTRLIEIIGEAARRVDPEKRSANPQIPWKEIVGTRDRLVHGYDQVDFDVLWKIVSDELPQLIRNVRRMLGDPDDSSNA